MALIIAAQPLIKGEADGEVLRLNAPISFWGGVDPASGIVIQGGHPDTGQSIAGKLLVLPGLIGSSSSSAIMLELLYIGKAPAALLMPETDAILSLGVVVAREMDYGSIPVLKGDFSQLHSGMSVSVDYSGQLIVA